MPEPDGDAIRAHVPDHNHEFVPTGFVGDWCCVHDGCRLAVMGTPIHDETFWSIVATTDDTTN